MTGVGSLAGRRVLVVGASAGVAVGPTQPTEFGDGFDPDLLGAAYADWARHGMLPETFMDTDELPGFLAGTLAAALAHPGIGVEHVVLRSPSPVLGRKPIHGTVDGAVEGAVDGAR